MFLVADFVAVFSRQRPTIIQIIITQLKTLSLWATIDTKIFVLATAAPMKMASISNGKESDANLVLVNNVYAKNLRYGN